MNKKLHIVLKVIEILKEDSLIIIANNMTYKLVLAVFPFLIFLLTLMGFFTIDFHYLTNSLKLILPTQLLMIIETLAAEVINIKRPKLLSLSLFIALFSATGGFMSLIYGLKKAYRQEETRSHIKLYFASFLLVGLFTLAVILTTVGMIFATSIMNILTLYYYISPFLQVFYNLLSFIISLVIVMITVILINRIALQKNVSVKNIIPGTIFTVISWAIASFGFNLYVRNFSFGSIYGSVGGVVVLLIWVNIVCNVLLLGGAINGALIEINAS